jgi:hypothetical protein
LLDRRHGLLGLSGILCRAVQGLSRSAGGLFGGGVLFVVRGDVQLSDLFGKLALRFGLGAEVLLILEARGLVRGPLDLLLSLLHLRNLLGSSRFVPQSALQIGQRLLRLSLRLAGLLQVLRIQIVPCLGSGIGCLVALHFVARRIEPGGILCDLLLPLVQLFQALSILFRRGVRTRRHGLLGLIGDFALLLLEAFDFLQRLLLAFLLVGELLCQLLQRLPCALSSFGRLLRLVLIELAERFARLIDGLLLLAADRRRRWQLRGSGLNRGLRGGELLGIGRLFIVGFSLGWFIGRVVFRSLGLFGGFLSGLLDFVAQGLLSLRQFPGRGLRIGRKLRILGEFFRQTLHRARCGLLQF